MKSEAAYYFTQMVREYMVLVEVGGRGRWQVQPEVRLTHMAI